MSQTKFIELTYDSADNDPVCINVDTICAFYNSVSKESTIIQLIGSSDNYIQVKETPEQIKELLYKFNRTEDNEELKKENNDEQSD